jgi:hypothetical protein
MDLSKSTVALDSAGPAQTDAHPRLSRCEKYLLAIFLFSLPFSNPWVHGDGVGYYAFARSLLIEHRLDFHDDWLEADREFELLVKSQGFETPQAPVDQANRSL